MKEKVLNPRSHPKWLQLMLSVTLLIVPVGCASVSVHKEIEYRVLVKPKKIYVQEFASEGGKWNVDREGAEMDEFKKKTQEMLTSDLIARISKHLVPAVRHDVDPSSAKQNGWLITGRFVRVNQGSRFLRAAIGFGTGGTKLETEVAVYDLHAGRSRKPFLTFYTTGGSGAQPGAIVGGQIGALPSAIGGASVGLTNDTRRTAREITATLSEYMFSLGWIKEDDLLKAKFKK